MNMEYNQLVLLWREYDLYMQLYGCAIMLWYSKRAPTGLCLQDGCQRPSVKQVQNNASATIKENSSGPMWYSVICLAISILHYNHETNNARMVERGVFIGGLVFWHQPMLRNYFRTRSHMTPNCSFRARFYRAFLQKIIITTLLSLS